MTQSHSTADKDELRSPSGDIYEGDLLDGRAHGKGKLISPSGYVYEGDFIDGKFTGKGSIIGPSGVAYKGDLIDGKLKGKLIWPDGREYEGDFVNEKPNGKGKYIWPNGDVYEGDFIDGRHAGKGKITWSDGDVYEGDWDNGQRTGKGKFISVIGYFYEGDFVDGIRSGKGKYTWPDGAVYDGDWVDGKRTGKGRYIGSDGDIYEGDWIDEKRTGKGKFTWPDGDVYEGDFIEGKRNGKGKVTWSDGNVYEGDWVDGKRTGKGKFTWPNGNVYEGDLVDGKQTGQGKFTWPSGDVYEGDWDNGKRTGKGKYTWPDGYVYEGDWVDAQRTGKGKFTWPNGGVYEGDFVDGKRTGKGKQTQSDGSVYRGDFIDGEFQYTKGLTRNEKRVRSDGSVYEGDLIDGCIQTGKGKLTLKDGGVYEGDFESEKFTGKGKFTWPNGDVYVGDWIKNRRAGKGRFIWSNGDVYEGDFINDGNRTGRGKFIGIDGDVYEGLFIGDRMMKKYGSPDPSARQAELMRLKAEYLDSLAEENPEKFARIKNNAAFWADMSLERLKMFRENQIERRKTDGESGRIAGEIKEDIENPKKAPKGAVKLRFGPYVWDILAVCGDKLLLRTAEPYKLGGEGSTGGSDKTYSYPNTSLAWRISNFSKAFGDDEMRQIADTLISDSDEPENVAKVFPLNPAEYKIIRSRPKKRNILRSAISVEYHWLPGMDYERQEWRYEADEDGKCDYCESRTKDCFPALWLNLLPVNGDAPAQPVVSLRLMEQPEFSQRPEDIVVRLAELALSRAPYAMYALGACYENGAGVSQDYAKALDLYRRAAEEVQSAWICLGDMYADGKGVAKDAGTAIRWYMLSIGDLIEYLERWYPEAPEELFTPEGTEAGIPLYRKLLTESDRTGYRYRALMADIFAIGAPRDYDEAARWYLAAINTERKVSWSIWRRPGPDELYRLALLYINQDVPVPTGERSAIQLLKEAKDNVNWDLEKVRSYLTGMTVIESFKAIDKLEAKMKEIDAIL